MQKDISEFIYRQKRKKKIKKAIIFFSIVCSLFILIIFRAPFFNIKNIVIENNKIVSNELIEKNINVIGQNIFMVNKRQITESILNNSYIESVKIHIKLPDSLVINVSERNAQFFINKDKEYFILNKELILLEKRDSIDGLNLVEIRGVEPNTMDLGKKIVDDTRIISLVNNLSTLLRDNSSGIKLDYFDISKPVSIIGYYGEVRIILGNEENLKEKLNKVFQILNDREIAIKKGYIDVSFKGNPVIKIE